MNDLTIRDPNTGIRYNEFSHKYFMKINNDNYEAAEKQQKEILEKNINFDDLKYGVLKDDIFCCHNQVLITDPNAKYFKTYKEAEKQYWDNCFDLGINGFAAAHKLSLLKGSDFLKGTENLKIFSK